jgi:hypothetical protein
VLETGTSLTPAINLYEAIRYARIPLFGEYLSWPLYYGKSLVVVKEDLGQRADERVG